jgi:hypothetical protein
MASQWHGPEKGAESGERSARTARSGSATLDPTSVRVDCGREQGWKGTDATIILHVADKGGALGQSYTRSELDLRISASPALTRPVRVTLGLVGLTLLALSLPIGFVCLVIASGGHGNPFKGSAIDVAVALELIAVPVLLIAVGIASLVCTNHWRLRLVAALALALGLDLLLVIVTMRLSEGAAPF